jgi:hypothetical protein
MNAVKVAVEGIGFKYVADNGFGDGTRPPKIPGYDRVPDFAIDRNSDGSWDMIIEIKSGGDWNTSDEQLTDFCKFSIANDLDFIIVVPDRIHDQAEQRYRGLGFYKISKFQLVPIKI